MQKITLLDEDVRRNAICNVWLISIFLSSLIPGWSFLVALELPFLIMILYGATRAITKKALVVFVAFFLTGVESILWYPSVSVVVLGLLVLSNFANVWLFPRVRRRAEKFMEAIDGVGFI